MPISEFAKKRNEVLFSLDKERILDFCGGDAPEDDEVFWAGVYKAICNITSTPPTLHSIFRETRIFYFTTIPTSAH